MTVAVGFDIELNSTGVHIHNNTPQSVDLAISYFHRRPKWTSGNSAVSCLLPVPSSHSECNNTNTADPLLLFSFFLTPPITEFSTYPMTYAYIQNRDLQIQTFPRHLNISSCHFSAEFLNELKVNVCISVRSLPSARPSSYRNHDHDPPYRCHQKISDNVYVQHCSLLSDTE